MTIIDAAPERTAPPPGPQPDLGPDIERTTSRAAGGAVWLAVADLRHRLKRFVVAVVAATCVLTLLLLVTGIVNQFDREPGQATKALNASHWVLREGIENPFSSNATFAPTLAAEVVAPSTNDVAIARLPITVEGEAIDAILVGHPTTGPGAPTLSDGRLAVDAGGIVVSDAVAVSVGDRILVGDREVEVVGQVHDTTLFAGMPLIFLPIDVARAEVAGGVPFVSAVLTDGAPTQVPDGLHVLERTEVAEAAKGPIERPILTLHIVRVLLALVAAMIIGAVVYLASIERTRDVAVLRAVGVRSSMLALGVAAQAMVMAMVAAFGALGLQAVVAPVFPLATFLGTGDLLAMPAVAALIAVFASYAAVRRTLRIDPSAAFAGIGA